MKTNIGQFFSKQKQVLQDLNFDVSDESISELKDWEVVYNKSGDLSVVFDPEYPGIKMIREDSQNPATVYFTLPNFEAVADSVVPIGKFDIKEIKNNFDIYDKLSATLRLGYTVYIEPKIRSKSKTNNLVVIPKRDAKYNSQYIGENLDLVNYHSISRVIEKFRQEEISAFAFFSSRTKIGFELEKFLGVDSIDKLLTKLVDGEQCINGYKVEIYNKQFHIEDPRSKIAISFNKDGRTARVVDLETNSEIEIIKTRKLFRKHYLIKDEQRKF